MDLHHLTESHAHEAHEHSLRDELVCHLPYAAFSVALSFIILAVVQFIQICGSAHVRAIQAGYHTLFHAFHYVHIVFAIVGTIVAFSRFSSNKLRGIAVGLISPAIFCTLSDAALPTIAGNILGLDIHLHICFFSWYDFLNVAPFMAVGLVTGYAIAHHSRDVLASVALRSHFVHIFVSSLASSFYIASHVIDGWGHVMGMLFLFLVIAVVVPCTISDVVVPMYVARWKWTP